MSKTRDPDDVAKWRRIALTRILHAVVAANGMHSPGGRKEEIKL